MSNKSLTTLQTVLDRITRCETQNLSKACSECSRYLDIYPTSAQLYYKYASILNKLNRIKLSAENYINAIQCTFDSKHPNIDIIFDYIDLIFEKIGKIDTYKLGNIIFFIYNLCTHIPFIQLQKSHLYKYTQNSY